MTRTQRVSWLLELANRYDVHLYTFGDRLMARSPGPTTEIKAEVLATLHKSRNMLWPKVRELENAIARMQEQRGSGRLTSDEIHRWLTTTR